MTCNSFYFRKKIIQVPSFSIQSLYSWTKLTWRNERHLLIKLCTYIITLFTLSHNCYPSKHQIYQSTWQCLFFMIKQSLYWPRSDVWVWGLKDFEMATGKRQTFEWPMISEGEYTRLNCVREKRRNHTETENTKLKKNLKTIRQEVKWKNQIEKGW